jgi:hypothetical protein
MRSSLFLDTTLQIRRVLTGRADQDRLEAQLIDLAPGLCTAAYVWMEYQRTVIADYAHVHQLVLNYDHWGDVMAHLLTGQRAFRPRSAVRCTHILGQLYAESQADWERAWRLLDHALSSDLQSQFWAHVAPLSDPIGCDLVTAGVNRQPDGAYTVATTCRKEKATCNLPDFMAERQPQLRAIADYLAAHPNVIKDQPRVERLLDAVLADPRAALGQAACWPLGDVIIALQVPPGALLWTLDRQDFVALAVPLGLELYAQA